MIELTLTLLFLTFFAYFLNNKKLISPAFLYAFSFLFASLFALLNEKNWLLNLNIKTFWVITFSVIEFIIICLIVDKFIQLIQNSKPNNKKIIKNYAFSFKKGKKKFVIIEFIQMLFIAISAMTIVRVTGQPNLANAVNTLNYSNNGFSNVTVELPTYVSLMLTFNQYFGMIGYYLFAKSVIIRKKINIYYLIEILLALGSTLLTGARGGLLMALVSIVTFIFMFIYKSEDINSIRIVKYIFIVLIGVILILFLLQWSAKLLGRNVDTFKPLEYVSIYVGAEIKNLDVFITENNFPIHGQVWGEQTFYSLINFAIKHLGLNLESYKLTLPFQYINGYSLGNVYTTLYPWLYDFGYKGIVFLTALMAFVSEMFYEFAGMNKLKIASLSQLFYGGIIAPTVVFSFFSNKFFEAFDIVSLTIAIIIWVLFNWIFRNDVEVITKNNKENV